MARRSKPKQLLQGAELKAFRSKVSKLKALGGVSKKTDARKQRPTRYMVGKIRKLEPLLRDEAVLVRKTKIRPDVLGDYQRTNQNVGRSVMIPKRAGEKLHVRKGFPEIERIIGENSRGRVVERRIPLPIDISSLDDFISDLRNRPEKWAQKRGDYPPWVFGFSIFGNRSQLFVDPEQLADWLERYTSIEDQDEAWESFILYSVDFDAGPFATGYPRSSRGGRKSSKPRKRKPLAGYRKVADMDRKRRERAAETAAQAEARRLRNRLAMANKRATDPKYRAREQRKDTAAKKKSRKK